MFQGKIFRSKRGFTLLELIITSAILLIAISGLLVVYVQVFILDESNRELVIAANDAQYVLEQIKGVAFASIGNYVPPALNNLQNENIPNPTVATISSRVKEVSVTVNWTGKRGRARSFSLTTRVFGEG